MDNPYPEYFTIYVGLFFLAMFPIALVVMVLVDLILLFWKKNES